MYLCVCFVHLYTHMILCQSSTNYYLSSIIGAVHTKSVNTCNHAWILSTVGDWTTCGGIILQAVYRLSRELGTQAGFYLGGGGRPGYVSPHVPPPPPPPPPPNIAK